MRFSSGLIIGIAIGITSTFFFGLLTEVLVLAALVGATVWGVRKWKSRESTPSTEKKSPSL